MIAISPDSLEQETNSCRIAITGIAYSIGIDVLRNRNAKSLLIDLSKAALEDDCYEYNSTVNKNISVIICNCLQLSSAETDPKLPTATQLAHDLGFNPHSLHYEKQISNSLQGLQVATDQLQTSDCEAVLLVLADPMAMTEADVPQTNFNAINQRQSILTSEGERNCSLAVLVIRRLNEAVESKKRVYASVSLLCKTNTQSAELDVHYEKAGISPQSINLFTLATKSSTNSLDSEIAKLSRWFLGNSNDINRDKKKEQIRNSVKEPWCSFRTSTDDSSRRSSNTISLLVETILAIQQRIFLPFISQELIQKIDLKRTPFYFNTVLRPWFHPQIHPQLRQMSPQPAYTPSLRRAAMHIIEEDGQAYHMVTEECEDINESKQKDLQPDWPSELFTFFADNRLQLARSLESLRASLNLGDMKPQLKDLAFTVNYRTAKLIEQVLLSSENTEKITVAFVCSTIEELIKKLTNVINVCLDKMVFIGNTSGYNENQDIYWNIGSYNIDNEQAQDKLAFVLPGLGAAYPNMLIELCLHFPEIRAIFDFIDEIAVLAGDQVRPSDRIFSRIDPYTKSSRETPASLAVMDSAVVTVLMAEWAIFTLLLNLGIVPDILLGCSTGEFAALTMSGAIDIMKSAPLFYHLSTGIVRALPINKLVNLRSLKINAALIDIQSQLNEFQGKVHLSADLSSSQLIVTGDKDSINSLAKIFESKNIPADFLPFAIPYHTTLVSDIVSPDDPDIEALQIDNPLIESWSCSLAKQYPGNPEQIRKMTTELFSKPILFRDSIEALYAKGVRSFVEVGPRGSLAPMISETLQSRTHTSLAANLADRPAITQLQYVLAALYVNNIRMDLNYLYLRRSAVLLPLIQEQASLSYKNAGHQPVDFNPPEGIRRGRDNTRTTTLLDPIAVQGTSILELTESFQKQLFKLEKQVMSYLMPNNSPANTNYLSKEISISQMFIDLPADQGNAIVCRQLQEEQLPSQEGALSSFAESKLTASEKEAFYSFRQFAKRRQWLAGRIATKDAVRVLFQNKFGGNLVDIEIEIGSLSSGKPYIVKIANCSTQSNPIISITHKDNRAIAVAADVSMFSAIGIDLESNDLEDNLDEFILSLEERNQIQYLSEQERKIAIKKIWSAKEAVAKMLGLGLPEFLRKLSVSTIDHRKDKFLVAIIENVGMSKDKEESREQTRKVEKYLEAHVGNLEKMILSLAVQLSSKKT